MPRAALQQNVAFLSTNNAAASAAAAAAENPERDLVNFPRRTRPIDRPNVRLGFIPEEWFTALHAKTGVSGMSVNSLRWGCTETFRS